MSLVAIVADLRAASPTSGTSIARTGSVAIGTDRLHYTSDLLLNGSVIVALVLDQFAGLAGADAVFGLLIALWLLWGAWSASSHALDQLMDREWPEEQRERFLAAAHGISRACRPPRPAHAHQRHASFRAVPRLGAGRLDRAGSARPARPRRGGAAGALSRTPRS